MSAVSTDPGRAARGAVTVPAQPSGQTGKLRLMAVHAHPDDESSKGAATMARYVREGVDVLVCTLTGGERGDILNKAMDRPEIRADLPRIRRAEMARAREILGVQQRFLGFVDSGLPEGDPLPPLPEGCFAVQPLEVAAAPLVRAVREFRPHVILTYDENGGYPHPDHIMTHRVSVEAFEAAADPDRYPGLRRAVAAAEAVLLRDVPPGPVRGAARGDARAAAWSRRTPSGWPRAEEDAEPADVARSPRRCRAATTSRSATRRCSRTRPRSTRTAAGSPARSTIQREAWPTEDYHLARSLVDTEKPEDDLFAGIREKVNACSC